MKGFITIFILSYCSGVLLSQKNSKISFEYYKGKDSSFVKNVTQYDSKGSKISSVFYFKNGAVESIANWHGGIEVGNFTIYHENGSLKECARYNYYPSYSKLSEINVVDSNFVEYSQTKSFMNFSLRVYRNPRVGEFVTYHSNGKTESIGMYKNYKCTNDMHYEIKVGIWKYYNDKGELLYERIYNDSGKFISDKFYW